MPMITNDGSVSLRGTKWPPNLNTHSSPFNPNPNWKSVFFSVLVLKKCPVMRPLDLYSCVGNVMWMFFRRMGGKKVGGHYVIQLTQQPVSRNIHQRLIYDLFWNFSVEECWFVKTNKAKASCQKLQHFKYYYTTPYVLNPIWEEKKKAFVTDLSAGFMTCLLICWLSLWIFH